MSKIYEVYDCCNGSLGFTKTKEEAVKIKRYHSYTGNYAVHIKSHILRDPKLSKAYEIPELLYVNAYTYSSHPTEKDFTINTYPKHNAPELNGVFASGKRSGVARTERGTIEVYFIIDTKPCETKASLTKRCLKKALEIFNQYNVK